MQSPTVAKVNVATLLLFLSLSTVNACPYMESKSAQQRKLQRQQNGNNNRNNNGNNNRNNNNANILSVNDAEPLDPLSVDQALALSRQDILSMLNDNRAAEFVRLSFHDCVGGVCDGCVDTSNPDNFGLDDPIENLAGLAIKYSATLTRADLWVWAGMVSAEATQDDTSIDFAMEYVGRPTCDSPQRGPDRSMPSAHITTGDLITFMEDNFAFTPRETTAIIGVHTLGEANENNSGFDGRQGWVRNEGELDNALYRTLLDGSDVDEDFEMELQRNGNNDPFPDQFLWRRGGRNDFMLNVDMALARDLEGSIDPTNGFVSCSLNDGCPDSSLLGFAMEYANSNTLWVTDFRNAFVKMTSIGCSNGVVACTQVGGSTETVEINAPPENTQVNAFTETLEANAAAANFLSTSAVSRSTFLLSFAVSMAALVVSLS